ncbi:MAG: hypothetical protein DRQ46_00535 [Gammaproteobacteria bacterium]|nr:MAG: hypothetical protein DRQ46_00535 [Gammaproteobacteria bacterium]
MSENDINYIITKEETDMSDRELFDLKMERIDEKISGILVSNASLTSAVSELSKIVTRLTVQFDAQTHPSQKCNDFLFAKFVSKENAPFVIGEVVDNKVTKFWTNIKLIYGAIAGIAGVFGWLVYKLTGV